jgi:2,4-dienoyl-CoA reductase-like NADH-dependent reductase (Old Yellow Enzyme family)
VKELDSLDLAYIHVMHLGNEQLLADIHKLWQGVLMLNRPGRARADIGKDISNGLADLEAYGQMVLANPDFLERVKADAPLNEPQRAGYYGGTAQGYTDYPTLAESKAA